MTTALDLALAAARQREHPYPTDELEQARIRVAARVADRLLHRTLSFDDRTGELCRDARNRAQARQEASDQRRCPAHPQARGDLVTLCRTLVSRHNAVHELQRFLAHRVPEPGGARILGCVLHLAGRDSAQFWWQFAAGAGDATAAYCLQLHHLALGEMREASFWARQTRAETAADGEGTGGRTGVAEGPGDGAPTGAVGEDPGDEPLGVLRLLGALCRDEPSRMTALADAVIEYVPDAVSFEEELELPLPGPDFAEQLERLEEGVKQPCAPAAG